MRRLRLLVVPYHLGRERVGMGKGPDAFVDAGIVERAKARGLCVDIEEVPRAAEFAHEAGATFDVLRAQARRMRAAVAEGVFPLVLGGSCSTAVAGTAAIGNQDRLGVVWFDAHGDANTPDTTVSGFFEGMPLAVLAGWCWRSMAATVPGFRPIPESQLLLAAVRALDPAEGERLDGSGIAVVPAARMRSADMLEEWFLPRVEALVSRVTSVHLHIDLDAIDLAAGRANEFAVGGGPTLDALCTCLDLVTDRANVVAASLSSYNPDCDDGTALQSGLTLLDRLLGAVCD